MRSRRRLGRSRGRWRASRRAEHRLAVDQMKHTTPSSISVRISTRDQQLLTKSQKSAIESVSDRVATAFAGVDGLLRDRPRCSNEFGYDSTSDLEIKASR